jgi:isochorismate hydrolase
MSINNSRGLVGLVVDMQEGFLRNFSKEERDDLVNAQVNLIESLNKKRIPVIIIEFKYGGKTDSRIKNAVVKTPFSKLIIKEEYSGFANTDLYQKLRDFSARELILMGIYASSCVMSTAEDAILRGYGLITGRTIISNSNKLILEEEIIDGKKLFERNFNGWYKEHSVTFNTTEGLIKYVCSD